MEDNTDDKLKQELEKMFDELWTDKDFWNRVGRSMFWNQEIRESYLKLEYDDDKG